MQYTILQSMAVVTATSRALVTRIEPGRSTSPSPSRVAEAGQRPATCRVHLAGITQIRNRSGSSQMPLVLAFAFIGGLLTIVAPCTLPIVPLVLGAGATGGYRRALAIMLGFGATFVALSVLLSSALLAAGITTGQLRLGSALALGIFGAFLVVPALGDRLARRLPQFAGFGSGGPGGSGGLLGGLRHGRRARVDLGTLRRPDHGFGDRRRGDERPDPPGPRDRPRLRCRRGRAAVRDRAARSAGGPSRRKSGPPRPDPAGVRRAHDRGERRRCNPIRWPAREHRRDRPARRLDRDPRLARTGTRNARRARTGAVLI